MTAPAKGNISIIVQIAVGIMLAIIGYLIDAKLERIEETLVQVVERQGTSRERFVALEGGQDALEYRITRLEEAIRTNP